MASTASTSATAQNAASQNQKLLEAMAKQFADKGLDWQKVADEMGSTPGAARERWRRYKLANGINTTAANDAIVKEGAPTPAKKPRTPKRKAEAETGEEALEEDDGTPSKKKKAPAAKKGKGVAKGDDKVTDEVVGDENEDIEMKLPAKKATPKKSATPKKAKVSSSSTNGGHDNDTTVGDLKHSDAEEKQVDASSSASLEIDTAMKEKAEEVIEV